jgi:hypothetical protein
MVRNIVTASKKSDKKKNGAAELAMRSPTTTSPVRQQRCSVLKAARTGEEPPGAGGAAEAGEEVRGRVMVKTPRRRGSDQHGATEKEEEGAWRANVGVEPSVIESTALYTRRCPPIAGLHGASSHSASAK